MAHLETALYWGLPCLGILLFLRVLVSLGWRRSRPSISTSQKNHRAGDVGESKVNKVLAGMKGIEYLSAFAFEFKNQGKLDSCQIDHLVRGYDKLWIVETKNWSGTVASNTLELDRWDVTARSGYRRNDLNPLIQASRQSKWLSQQTGIPVEALIAMVGSARPNQGSWPIGVVGIVELARVLEGRIHNLYGGDGASSGQISQGWKIVKRLEDLDKDGSVTRRHVERMSMRHANKGVGQKKGSLRRIVLFAAVFCGAAWWYLPTIMGAISPILHPQSLPTISMPHTVAPIPMVKPISRRS